MKRSKTNQPRVWIELEAHNDDAVNVKRAKLASTMLKRLCPTMKADPIFWNEGKQSYCRADESGAYTTLTDNGDWFNLVYLATNEIEVAA